MASAPSLQPQSMSHAARVLNVFWAPREAFEDLAVRPRWWVPLILLTILSFTYTTAYSRRVGWETLLRHQIESNPRLQQQLTAAQQEDIIQRQSRFVGIFAYGGAALGVGIGALAVAGVLLGVFRMFSGTDITFRQIFSVTCYSFLPTALFTLLALLVMFLKEPADFDIQNPLALNAGWLIGRESAAWLRTLLTSIDLFTIWVILLVAYGLSAAARKTAFSKSLTLVASAWLIWVLVKTGWAAAFG